MESNKFIVQKDLIFTSLPTLPFSFHSGEFTGAEYDEAKKNLFNFVETHQYDAHWRLILEYIWIKITQPNHLPSLKEINVLFSFMKEREKVKTILLDLKSESIRNWAKIILLGNVKEKVRRLVANEGSRNIMSRLEVLEQKIIGLSSCPAILSLLYPKLATEARLFDPKLAITCEELETILDMLHHLPQMNNNGLFYELNDTPLSAWIRLLRENTLRFSLLSSNSEAVTAEKDLSRCLFLLSELEESFGRKKIDRLVACIQQVKKMVDYDMLATILVQLRYEQLTLDESCFSQIEKAPFSKWFSIFSKHHEKEKQKDRTLPVFLKMMQNEVTNKKIDILYSQQGKPPVIETEIESIHTQLETKKHPLTILLFENDEVELKQFNKKIKEWTIEDISKWSKAFRVFPESPRLVEQYLSETIAIISQAIFLQKKFYPRDVQYLALLCAFFESNHAQKIISQIATGQGKTITGTMLALLRIFLGNRVDFITSSSVLAEETLEEIDSICWMFNVSSACNAEVNEGPFFLQLIEGEPSSEQMYKLRSKKGMAIIKKGESYTIGLMLDYGDYFEYELNASKKWDDFKKKMTTIPFFSRKCTVGDGLHDEVLKILHQSDVKSDLPKLQDEIEKLQDAYRCDIVCGDLQSFMRSDLFDLCGKNITQNRRSFAIMDEVDRLLDEMRDILYLSHEIPDMHHLNNLLVAIWGGVNHIHYAKETKENIESLTQYFLNQLSPGNCSTAQRWENRILIPSHLEAFVRRRLPTWVRSAYIAKNGLSQDGEYIVTRMGEEDGKGVYLVDKDTGVASRKKELSNGTHQFLRLKHQGWPKPLSLKAIYCDPVSFLLKNYKQGFFGMTGTVGSEQDRRYFEKLFEVNKYCIVPRHELLHLKVDSPILVPSFFEQMQYVATIIQKKTLTDRQPVAIFCDSIADAKAMTAYLQKKLPKTVSIYTHIHSFEFFSKGGRNDPLKPGDILVTTPVDARGKDLHLNEAVKMGLYLIKLSISKHERADRQVDGRTAREGLPGGLIHVLCPSYGESSLEEMQAVRDRQQAQSLEKIRNEDLHQNYINRQLFEMFNGLFKEVEEILRKTKETKFWEGIFAKKIFFDEEYIERQMAALKTHWSFWLDEVEQKMEDKDSRNIDLLYAKFQIFRKEMLAIVEKEGPIKLITGPGEITALGIWFGLKKMDFSHAHICFDHVIQNFYPFSGQALYYKAYVLLETAKPDKFQERREAVRYLKRAQMLFNKEISQLKAPIKDMMDIDFALREMGKGLNDSEFKKIVTGMIDTLKVYLTSIEHLIGMTTDPSIFLLNSDDSQEAEALYRKMLRKGRIKGYRISKKISVNENNQLKILLIDNIEQEIELPVEFKPYEEKIIAIISTRKEGNREARTVTYEEYFKLVFENSEENADDKQKAVMVLLWHFLQEERIILQPNLNYSRNESISLKRKGCVLNPLGRHPRGRPKRFPESGWVGAAGLLRILDEIKMNKDALPNLAERGRIPMEVLSFFRHSLEFEWVIRVEKKPVRWSWKATGLLLWSSLQIAAGIYFCCPALVAQGQSDMVFLIMSAIKGNFSMENYFGHKVTSVVTASICAYGKPLLKDVVEQSTMTPIGKDILLRAINAIPATALKSTEMTTSFFSQYKEALGSVFMQTTEYATMNYILNTFSPTDVDARVRNTLGDKIQKDIKLEFIQKVKEIGIEILEHSESSRQAGLIIQAVIENTLKENLSIRPNFIYENLSRSALCETGNMLGKITAEATNNNILGHMTRLVVSHLDKVGAILSMTNAANTMIQKIIENLEEKRDKLKLKGQESTRTDAEIKPFTEFLDEKIRLLKRDLGNHSLSNAASMCVTPVVQWTFNSLTEKLNQVGSSNRRNIIKKNEEQSTSEEENLIQEGGEQIVSEKENFNSVEKDKENIDSLVKEIAEDSEGPKEKDILEDKIINNIAHKNENFSNKKNDTVKPESQNNKAPNLSENINNSQITNDSLAQKSKTNNKKNNKSIKNNIAMFSGKMSNEEKNNAEPLNRINVQKCSSDKNLQEVAYREKLANCLIKFMKFSGEISLDVFLEKIKKESSFTQKFMKINSGVFTYVMNIGLARKEDAFGETIKNATINTIADLGLSKSVGYLMGSAATPVTAVLASLEIVDDIIYDEQKVKNLIAEANDKMKEILKTDHSPYEIYTYFAMNIEDKLDAAASMQILHGVAQAGPFLTNQIGENLKLIWDKTFNLSKKLTQPTLSKTLKGVGVFSKNMSHHNTDSQQQRDEKKAFKF